MNPARLNAAIAALDQAHAEDPATETWQGEAVPRSLLYARRMSGWLAKLDPEAPEASQLAARAQHLYRWKIPRSDYPAGREGYLQWRRRLYQFQAGQAEAILLSLGYDEAAVAAVKGMVGKQGVKRNADVQRIEDVACLVFLEFYFAEFAQAHDEEKLLGIVQKTWLKMSEQGRAAAQTIALPDDLAQIVAKALSH